MSSPGLLQIDTTGLLVSTAIPVVLGVMTGLPGVVVGVGAMAAVAVFGRPFGFATAQVGLLGVPFSSAILAELVFGAVLLAEIVRTYRLDPRAITRVLAGVLVLVASVTTLAALANFELRASAMITVTTVALASYALHRYAVVTLNSGTEGLR